MNARYILGIFITVILLTINQAFIQYWLSQKKYDANAINLAGKQRMISQRINLEFYRIKNDNAAPTILNELFLEWKEVHQKLEKSEFIIQTPILASLQKLNQEIDFVNTQIDNLDKNKPFTLAAITANQHSFLNQMDRIVKAMEKESDRKLDFIIWMEYILFLTSLIILILEVIFIYRPIEKASKEAKAAVQDKNEKLEVTHNNLQKKNKELEQFTYIASHDLQEPLRTISSLVNFLKTRYDEQLDDRGQQSLEYLWNSVQRMRSLIKGLLDYSILGKEKTKTSIECNRILEEITEDLASQIHASKAKITWDKLPIISGNPLEIQLLFQNLISNGIKFHKPGIPPKVHIKASKTEQNWLFSITDNGIGIEQQHQEKIFSFFQRIHSKDEFNGSGIGLAHCAKIVNLHNGKIWVESTPNVGSTFHFTIKLLQKEENYEKETELHLVN